MKFFCAALVVAGLFFMFQVCLAVRDMNAATERLNQESARVLEHP